ncbi:MAG: amidohydrolase [Candidatus Thorarchaeota archaeon]
MYKMHFYSFLIIIFFLFSFIHIPYIAKGFIHSSDQNAPDLIVFNGTIITMENSQPEVEAVAISGDKFTEIGNKTNILALAGSKTVLLDLKGRTLLPGFIDAHSHWIGDRNLVEQGSPNEAIKSAISNGWTSISELFVNEERLNELRSLDQENNIRIRVNAYLPLSWQFERFGDWYKSYQPRYEYSSLLRIAGVKLFMDRWIGNTTQLYFNQSELTNLVQDAFDSGYQVAIHSVTENATDIVLNVYEDMLAGRTNDLYRFRIEHLVELRDDQILRLKNLGIIASFQFPWFNSDYESGLVAVDFNPENLHLLARWRDLLDVGVQSMGSTDYPWSDGPIGSSIEAIYQAVTRIGRLGNTPADWMMNQTITVKQALRLLTIDAAYGTFQENVKGSIKEGKFADFVILSENPLITPLEKFMNIEILSTRIGAIPEFCSNGSEELCSDLLLSSSTSTMSLSSKSLTTSSPVTSPIHIEIIIMVLLSLSIINQLKRKK